jgi:hypothetical protein
MGRGCSTHEERRGKHTFFFFFFGKSKGKRLLGDEDVDGRIILKLILEK